MPIYQEVTILFFDSDGNGAYSQMFYAIFQFVHESLKTLHDFRLSQTKDWHCKTIMAISVIVAVNRWCCVAQWEMTLVKVLRPKIAYDTSWWSSHSVYNLVQAGKIHVYWPTNKNGTRNQPDMAIKHKTETEARILSISPTSTFFNTHKNTTAKVWFIMLFLFTTSTCWWRFIIL